MTKSEFLNELNEIIQRDEQLVADEILEEIEEWDSMSVLGVMSMFDIEFSITITADDLRAAKTVQDLIDMAGNNLSD